MGFIVKADVQLVPPSPFLLIADSREYLGSYGWPRVQTEQTAVGKITTPEVRTITYYLDGKIGATKRTAEKDVSDALSRVGLGLRAIRAILEGVERAPGEVGKAAGSFVGGTVAGAGEASGLGTIGTVLAVILTMALLVAVAAVALKKA